MHTKIIRTSRRKLVSDAAAVGAAALLAPRGLRAETAAPAVVTSDSARPQVAYGVQIGDVVGDRALLWSRVDRPARMIVELATTESMKDAMRIPGPVALDDTDYAAKLDLVGLPPGQTMFYRVSFLDLGDLKTTSEPVTGRFVTPPAGRSDVRFVWSGDTAGLGWGINPDFGGMKIYETMRAAEPHFFIHSGDTIYADGPIKAEYPLADGTVWKNLVTEEKSKVAETLREFRGNYAYNLMDENVRRFNAAVPSFMQWDDHEVTNNWYWQKVLGDPTEADLKAGKVYAKERRVSVLAGYGMRAFMEYMPIRQNPMERDRLYSSFRYGPHLEVFRIDMRSYRGPNGPNRQAERSADTAFLGEEQLRWLKRALLESDATWKVIAADMPIGLIVGDGKEADGTPRAENGANGDGPALGRELEIAELLTFIHRAGVKNTVWLTADVHYTAAHRYDPNKAQYTDFAPFWEFVSGPLNAGTFGPNALDNTFGPQVVYQKAPENGQVNLPPSAGMQFFGQVDIAGASGVMTVRLKDIAGATLFTQEILPEV